MSRRLDRPTRAAARLTVAVALMLVPAAVATGAPADAATSSPVATPSSTTPEAPVAIRLTRQLPLEPRPGDTLTVSGVLVNEGDREVTGVSVRLRLSPTPVRDRAELAPILAGEAGRTGISVPATLTRVTGSLAPGARSGFSLEVPVDDLALPDAPAVIVLGVEALGDVSDDGRGERQAGFVRSFLPWFPQPDQVEPTRVLALLPLSAAPSRAGDGVFLGDGLGRDVASGGRLDRLLTAGEAAPGAVSWLVDPALLESLTDMADGYEVETDGGIEPGTHAADAAAWLARLRTLTTGADVSAAAYGFPDVVALHRAGLDLDIALASTTASSLPAVVLGRPVPRGPGWPIGGLTDDGTLDALRAAGTTVVVVSASSLPPAQQLSYTPSGTVDLAGGGSPLRALLSDPDLSALLAAPRAQDAGPLADPVVRRQTAIAHLAMTTLELPQTARTLVVAPGAWWSADAVTTGELLSTLSSPWSTPVTLPQVVASEASEVPRDRAEYPARAQAAELSQGYLGAVAAARERLAGLRSVAPDTGDSETTGLEAGLTRTESGAWRNDRSGGRTLLGSVSQEIDAQIDQVRVLSRAPVTLPGESAVIPVTVSNDLERTARVGLRLTGTPSVRFEAAPLDAVAVAPGQKRTLEVQARVLGTGPVTVQVQLLTPEGEAFGTPVTMEVRSAAYARAAQGVVIGLFAVLVVLLGVNLVRRRRGLRHDEGAAAVAGDDVARGGGA